MTAWLFSGDLALLVAPPGSRGVASPKNTTIKQSPHRFVFCGHDGRGLAMTPTRTLFCVLQGIFLIGASTATTAYTCEDRSDIVGFINFVRITLLTTCQHCYLLGTWLF
ncbi:hypothetical protein V5799_001525 [Amblyomma americanum]|uniref:Uncharacterized protein n=1 Tax=Amblyomma americanum TaxID=6943 RepID=A0AAQ4CZZ7_AMBAM